MSYRCNAYGAENAQGHGNPYGGLIDKAYVSVQPYCENAAEHRFRWVCANGHQGDIVAYCRRHYLEFTGSLSVPWNMRRDIQTCFRCASLAPDCDDPEHARMMVGRPGKCGCRQPKVPVRLVSVS